MKSKKLNAWLVAVKWSVAMSLLAVFGAPMALAQYDFGDAPAPYPTLLADNGARHFVGSPFSPILGLTVDAEPDGQPSAAADGDDLNGIDDEDGVVFLTLLVPGEEFVVEVSSRGAMFFGQMSAWIDFDRNGSWADEGERIFQNVVLAPGESMILTNRVPVDASPGPTYARFRVSTVANLSYDGEAPDGEVEDYQVLIEGEEWMLDFGDAPAPFPTRLGDDGARHVVSTNGPWMGLMVDTDPNGLPSVRADGDDLRGSADEDGVTLLTAMIPGSNAWFEVDLSHSPTAGFVNAWFDLNANGTWADPGEHVLADELVAAGATHIFSVYIPVDATPGYRYARFRCSTQPGLSFVGEAPDGEVEDYRFAVLGPRPTDAIVVTNLTRSSSGLLLEWAPEEGLTYQVQRASSLLDDGAWVDVDPPVMAPTSSLAVPPAADLGFFRVTTPLNTL